jgi:hypothetical protein
MVYTLQAHPGKRVTNGLRCNGFFHFNKYTLNSYASIHCLVVIVPVLTRSQNCRAVLDEHVIRIKDTMFAVITHYKRKLNEFELFSM